MAKLPKGISNAYKNCDRYNAGKMLKILDIKCSVHFLSTKNAIFERVCVLQQPIKFQYTELHNAKYKNDRT